jgi:Alcohol dehydrogenase GroES-like domain
MSGTVVARQRSDEEDHPRHEDQRRRREQDADPVKRSQLATPTDPKPLPFCLGANESRPARDDRTQQADVAVRAEYEGHPMEGGIMHAVTVTEFGATPTVAEIPTPEPGPGQVLIKLRAAGMNPMDRTLASGAWKPMPATFPMVLGADGAGVVEQLGEGASRFSLGDDLFGQLLIPPLGSAGTYADERILVT